MYYLNFWNAYPEQDAHKIVISAESQHWWVRLSRVRASAGACSRWRLSDPQLPFLVLPEDSSALVRCTLLYARV